MGATIYTVVRFPRNRAFVDFEVYSRAGGRAWAAQPLYRSDDGHFQFKYLPAFAFGAVPFAKIDQTTAKAAWFTLTFGLIVAFVRRSVARCLAGGCASDRSVGSRSVSRAFFRRGAESRPGQRAVWRAADPGAHRRAGAPRSARGARRRGDVHQTVLASCLFPWLAVVGGLTAALASTVAS
jgi:hypothetical protein